MDRFIVFVNQTGKRAFPFYLLIEGRDKLCKVIQYGSRIIKHNQSTKNKELAAKFQGLMGKYY
jgi:Peroxisomal biogenesis factor 11 (PEX11)